MAESILPSNSAIFESKFEFSDWRKVIRASFSHNKDSKTEIWLMEVSYWSWTSFCWSVGEERCFLSFSWRASVSMASSRFFLSKSALIFEFIHSSSLYSFFITAMASALNLRSSSRVASWSEYFFSTDSNSDLNFWKSVSFWARSWSIKRLFWSSVVLIFEVRSLWMSSMPF
jgi:hypothetical protein